MSIKRALVVDDSKAARRSLQKLLTRYELEVDLAATGEEALESLKRQSVDVIFMDHTMPGMDGLEAVAAIKANPQTATIPVMMYTTREGEVYVGQARALGAVGVLPKNVEPQELFEMLFKLGLVSERRFGDGEGHDVAGDESSTEKRAASQFSRPDSDNHSPGVSLESLVRRILEDQHVVLRSDILRSRRAFAKDVAREVMREHLALEASLYDEEPEPMNTRSQPSWLTTAALMAAVVLGVMAWQFKDQRDQALAQVSTLQRSAATVEVVESTPGDGVADRLLASAALIGGNPLSLSSADVTEQAWQNVVRNLNADNTNEMGQLPFGRHLALKLEVALEQLEALGFRGELRLVSHLGRFCLDISEQGQYELPAPTTPMGECPFLGNTLDYSNFVSDRMSSHFRRFMANLEQVQDAAVQVTPVALSLSESQAAYAYPQPPVTASDWNAVATANNRVFVELIPDPA